MQAKIGRKLASAAVATALALAPFSASAQASGRGRGPGQNPFNGIAITGTGEDGRAFSGVLNIQRFQLVGDTIVAVGSLSGKLGNQPVNHQSVAWPLDLSGSGATGALQGKLDVSPAVFEQGSAGLKVVPAQAACDILNLVLGPLELNLLGLNVFLDTVVLDITAQPGGGLLGDLLCAVANLLNPLGSLLQLLQALNNLINFFNGLFP